MTCVVNMWAWSSKLYWEQQDPKPAIMRDGEVFYLHWLEHKFDPEHGNCVRCGVRK